ncbi:molecular chaperone DjiA [Amaricoccus solimangrovi]|uniref:Molecular chaperone DjiA n=1 Tax=Amaricoccus solimangrovi TaxID=2589815 RepID=A0A501X0E7_9RHOB|nr:molecular chaperone DjiA [Amaricoccus solimangrovi]TPE53847.1 molecular chaperone DjiA [Amaricoccus solimangrovi]
MSIWTRITEVISAIVARGEALLSMFERRAAPPERSVAFTIAIICLAAKMAKADGRVNASEVTAFRQVFHIDPRDEPAAARVFNLARQDIAGFEAYASQIARMFADQPRILEDLLEGLFHIALADGSYHEQEAGFLSRVAEIFGVPEAVFACVEARMTSSEARDPWKVLGVPREASLPEVRSRWRELVRAHHPDKMIARGLPVETVNLANARLATINRAWEEISRRARELQPAE